MIPSIIRVSVSGMSPSLPTSQLPLPPHLLNTFPMGKPRLSDLQFPGMASMYHVAAAAAASSSMQSLTSPSAFHGAPLHGLPSSSLASLGLSPFYFPHHTPGSHRGVAPLSLQPAASEPRMAVPVLPSSTSSGHLFGNKDSLMSTSIESLRMRARQHCATMGYLE